MLIARKIVSDLGVGAALLSLAPCLALAAADGRDVVEALSLTEVETARFGPDLHATLPGGARVEVDFDRSGALEEIEAEGAAGFPASAVAPVIPAALRASPDWPAEATLHSVEFEEGRIEIEGARPDGRRFEAEFALDGRLLEMELDR